jgi:hypothetical protein
MSYIRKTSDIFISDEMSNILHQMKDQSEVARLLIRQRHPVEELVEDHVNYISISKSDRTKISYMSVDRMDKVDGDLWHSSKRFNVKPGAFVRKVFVNTSEKEVEKFATLFKNIQTALDFTFKVIEGSEIPKYYLYDSYVDQSSSLGASCMKHSSCQDFLGIYVDNPETIKMLVMLDKYGKLIGRSLLWNIEPKIMDRIYTIQDEDYTSHFKKWADDNGYLYKREQKWNNTLFFQTKEKVTKLELSVKLKNVNYRRYPYLDTFKFFDQENGLLYNYIPSKVEVSTLSTTDGTKQPSDFLSFDGKTSLFHHYHDTIWIDYMGYRTLANNTYYSNVNDRHIMMEDAVFNEELRDYIFIDDSKNDQESINRKLEYIRKREREKLKKKKKSNSEGLSSIFERYFGGNIDAGGQFDYSLSGASVEELINTVRQRQGLSNDTEPVTES